MTERIMKTLEKGTVVKIAGIPVELQEDIQVLTTAGNWKIIQEEQRQAWAKAFSPETQNYEPGRAGYCDDEDENEND